MLHHGVKCGVEESTVGQWDRLPHATPLVRGEVLDPKTVKNNLQNLGI